MGGRRDFSLVLRVLPFWARPFYILFRPAFGYRALPLSVFVPSLLFTILLFYVFVFAFSFLLPSRHFGSSSVVSGTPLPSSGVYFLTPLPGLTASPPAPFSFPVPTPVFLVSSDSPSVSGTVVFSGSSSCIVYCYPALFPDIPDICSRLVDYNPGCTVVSRP